MQVAAGRNGSTSSRAWAKSSHDAVTAAATASRPTAADQTGPKRRNSQIRAVDSAIRSRASAARAHSGRTR